MRRTRPTALLPAVLLVLVLSACGAGADPATTAAVGASSDAGTVAGQPDEGDDAPATAGAQVPGVADPDDGTADDGRASGGAALPATHDWSAPTVAGGEVDLATLTDGPVVLWMWAPWCSVCNREAPEVAELLAELPDDVTLVGVAGRDDLAPMQDFVARHGLGDMLHAVDVDGSLWARYGVSDQPAWVFLTPDGQAAVAPGALGREGVLAAVEDVFGA